MTKNPSGVLLGIKKGSPDSGRVSLFWLVRLVEQQCSRLIVSGLRQEH